MNRRKNTCVQQIYQKEEGMWTKCEKEKTFQKLCRPFLCHFTWFLMVLREYQLPKQELKLDLGFSQPIVPVLQIDEVFFVFIRNWILQKNSLLRKQCKTIIRTCNRFVSELLICNLKSNENYSTFNSPLLINCRKKDIKL